jgi:hypothetical protein
MRAAHTTWSARGMVAVLLVIGTAACGSSEGTGSRPPSDVPSVTASPIASPGASSAGSEPSAADGIYSLTITERDAKDAGVPHGQFSQVVGDYELDLVRGELAMYFTGVITLDLLRGTYTVRGNELDLAPESGPDLRLRWTRDHGALSLTLEDPDRTADGAIDEMIFSAHTWERIG